MDCIVYVSDANCSFGERELEELARSAASRNVENGISGYLFFDAGRFTQYFEGEPEAVDDLFTRLSRDDRHTLAVSGRATGLQERRFARWSMQRVRRRDLLEIQLEHVLTDHLLFVGRLAEGGDLPQGPLWRMVEAIARGQRSLAY